MWGGGRWARPSRGKSRGDGGRLEWSAFTCFSLSSLSERAAGKQLRENGYVSYFGGPAYSGVPWLCVPLSREVCPYRMLPARTLIDFSAQVNGYGHLWATPTNLQPRCNRRTSPVNSQFIVVHTGPGSYAGTTRPCAVGACRCGRDKRQRLRNSIEPRQRRRRRPQDACEDPLLRLFRVSAAS